MSRMVRVRSIPDSGIQQSIELGPHLLVGDEPVDAGGQDKGPAPYDLLLAALGSCTSMTVQLYAARKGWPLEQVEVRLTHRKVPLGQCPDCAPREGLTDKALVDVFDKQVYFRGPLDDEQKARLLEISTRCPVHRTLSGTIHLRSTLLAEAPPRP